MGRVDRRQFATAVGALLALSLVAGAQRAERIRRIGFVSPTPPGSRNDAFLQGLQKLGYVDGHNVAIDMRFADGRPERLPALVDELIRLKPDVLVVGATIGASVAKRATTTIPIVFAGSSDPVAGGVVANLARPEGNITGTSTAYADGFAGKWLELLKAIVPELEHVAVLWSSSNATAARFVKDVEAAARALNMRVDAHQAANAAELELRLAAIGSSGVRGLIVTPSPFAVASQDKLVRFAASQRLAAIYFSEEFADAGGLLAYGPSIADAYRRAAAYVDKILKGASPGDLPVEQPTRYELTINLATARDLGLKVPQSLLLRADRLIG